MKKRIFCTFVALTSIVASVLAVPAKPTPVQYTQPDGTIINVLLRGDERHHIMLTEDGYLLAEVDDALYYGDVDSQGLIVSSGVLAKEVANRTRADIDCIQKLDMVSALERLEQRKALLSNQKRSMRRMPGVGKFPYAKYPVTGNSKGIVVLVEYQDVKFNLTDPYDYFTRMLNEEGFSDYNCTGSARDYFEASSCGKFQPEFDVYGPVTLPERMSYYGTNDMDGSDKLAYEMVIHACQILDGDVDFSQYDCDGNGFIDNVYLFYAGRGEATGGGANSVWPHNWEITSVTDEPYIFDGVQLDCYACSNEWDGTPSEGKPNGIGTFVHEFSHVMGLPDLYATTYTTSFTPGTWSILDQGPYNNDGRTPPLYGIFERNALGWMTPEPIIGPMSVQMSSIEQNVGFVIETGDPNEFFLFENRQRKGWDRYIPGHGMLVWHVLYEPQAFEYNIVNNNPMLQLVDLEEADGLQNSATRAGDAFPGTDDITSFTDNTNPSMRTWDGRALNLPITNIKEPYGKGIIKFDVCGGGKLVTAADGSYTVESDGIADIAADLGIEIRSGAITAAEPVNIFQLDGRALYLGQKGALELNPGLYIVGAADGKMRKIYVR